MPGAFVRNQSLKTFPCSTAQIFCFLCVFPCHLVQFCAHSASSIKHLLYQLRKMLPGADPCLCLLISLNGSGPFLISVLLHLNEAEPTAFCYNCISCCSCNYLLRLPSMQDCRALRRQCSCKETTGTVSS